MSVYLDPSVLVSIAVADANTERARAFAYACEEKILFSDFGILEITSAFSRFVRTKQLPLAQARQSIADFHTWAARALTAAFIQTSDLIVAETALARFDLSLKGPDALHVAIAQRLGATLVTFVRKQAESGRRLGVASVEP